MKYTSLAGPPTLFLLSAFSLLPALACAEGNGDPLDPTPSMLTALPTEPGELRAVLPSSSAEYADASVDATVNDAAGRDASDSRAATSDASAEAAASTTCSNYAAPNTPATCRACGTKPCQPNGCYNGYGCDKLAAKCVPLPMGCP